jgi:hypothetical protein
MQEEPLSPRGSGTWPEPAASHVRPLDGGSQDCAAAVAQITSVTSETRWITLVAGGLLTADLIAAPVMMAAMFGRDHVYALASVGLLALVGLSWLRTSVLMVMAEWPLAEALGELRRAAGAPVDLSAPWVPFGVRPMDASEADWYHVVRLIGAATLRHTRARLALSWAVITTIGLCVWMFLSFAIAAMT